MTSNGCIGAARASHEQRDGRVIGERDAPFVRLLEAVASAEADAGTVEEALRGAIRAVCAWTGWPIGHLYGTGREGSAIDASDLWIHPPEPGLIIFQAASVATPLGSGEGLPGRVIATGRPAWIADVTGDPGFPRADAARMAGIRGAFAFAVDDGESILGVLEFFSHERVEPDARLLEVAGHLGKQLGRAIAVRRATAELRSAEDHFRSVAEAANDAIVAADSEGRIIFWNTAAGAMFGYPGDEALGRDLSILMPESYRADHDAGMERIVRHGESAARVMGQTIEVEGLRRDGRVFPLEMSLGTWTTDEGRFFSSVLRDITERRASEQRVRVLLDAAPDAIFEIGEDGRITLANDQAGTLIGRGDGTLTGEEFARLILPADRRLVARRFSDARDQLTADPVTVRIDRVEARLDRGEDAPLPVEITFRPLDAETGRGVLAIARDMSERKRFEAELRHLADHDALTGLYNRRRFEAELERHVAHARRYGPGALLFVDLDGFKYVNDTRGHRAGDELIQAVGGAIRGRLRRGDVVARLGGDEFAVLLLHADRVRARTVAEHVLAAVRDGAAGADRAGARVTASVGIAHFDQGTRGPDELLVQADVAMYQAKEAGGDQARGYDPRSRGGNGVRLRWTDRIRRALDDDAFVLHCQPIYDLRAGRITQYELLLRLPGADGELIPPNAFIGHAERYDLVQEIDRWVTLRAIDLIDGHRDPTHPLRLEVNLSGRTIGDEVLLELVRRRLAETRIDPSCLVFEITETAAIANMQQARRFATALTDLGCRFALDDFGAGFSSFYYLKHLPLDYIKIDGDFVRSLSHSSTDRLVVRSMVDIARGMGLQTIAEYVEDHGTQAMLHAQGVDFAQGFLHGRPGPVAEVLGRHGRRTGGR